MERASPCSHLCGEHRGRALRHRGRSGASTIALARMDACSLDAVVDHGARHVTLLVMVGDVHAPELRVLFDLPAGAATAEDVQVQGPRPEALAAPKNAPCC